MKKKFVLMIILCLIFLTSCAWSGTFKFSYNTNVLDNIEFSFDYFNGSREREILVQDSRIDLIYDDFYLHDGQIIIEMFSPGGKLVFRRRVSPNSSHSRHFVVRGLNPGQRYRLVVRGVNARRGRMNLYFKGDYITMEFKG